MFDKKEWFRIHKPQKKLYDKNYRQKNQERIKMVIKNCKMLKRYGIDLETFNNLYEQQNGQCCICADKMTMIKTEGKFVCIDHDHNTKKVRGLLCNSCNLMIGYASDNPKILQNAIKYLENKNE